ncbi:MAG: hypothetical protein AMXMBFR13_44640 [Phycisphaerae bacterium]
MLAMVRIRLGWEKGKGGEMERTGDGEAGIRRKSGSRRLAAVFVRAYIGGKRDGSGTGRMPRWT